MSVAWRKKKVFKVQRPHTCYVRPLPGVFLLVINGKSFLSGVSSSSMVGVKGGISLIVIESSFSSTRKYTGKELKCCCCYYCSDMYTLLLL